jgi:hypothetical protein
MGNRCERAERCVRNVIEAIKRDGEETTEQEETKVSCSARCERGQDQELDEYLLVRSERTGFGLWASVFLAIN